MLSARLIQMIQDHADELMSGLIGKLKTHPRTPAYRRFSDTEIHERLYTVYKELGAWMVGKPEDEIRQHYEGLGLRRYRESTPLYEVTYAAILTKNHLLEYIRTRGLAGTALEIYAEQELSHKINQFFDNAIYYTTKGYEKAAGSEATADRAPSAKG
ncbi:MAG: hypothetical protein HYX73_05830 [Acidobacteria bacterium]|nr:hypothetical protein [Acidobacteriota bacterium]